MKTELTYYREGDYLIPDLIPPASPHIGIRGIRRKITYESITTASTLGCYSAAS